MNRLGVKDDKCEQCTIQEIQKPLLWELPTGAASATTKGPEPWPPETPLRPRARAAIDSAVRHLAKRRQTKTQPGSQRGLVHLVIARCYFSVAFCSPAKRFNFLWFTGQLTRWQKVEVLTSKQNAPKIRQLCKQNRGKAPK